MSDGLRYSPRYGGGDVDDPAFLDLLARLQTWRGAPASVRDLVRQFRPLVEQDADAWRRRHEESVEVDRAREDLAALREDLTAQGFDVDTLGVDPGGLARLVAELRPWERAGFDRLLAEETGQAWTRLPAVRS